MSNMSYCRFQNTASDLSDCVDALGEIIEGEQEPLGSSHNDQAEIGGLVSIAQNAVEILTLLADAQGLDLADLIEQIDRNGARKAVAAALANASPCTEEA